MSKPGSIIPLDDHTRELYCKYDLKYFLNLRLAENETSEADLRAMQSAYLDELQKIKALIKKNRKQAHYFIDGQIRKCHSGGFLPSILNLDESRGKHGFLDYPEIGRTLATFELWRKAQKRKILHAKFGDISIKVGALLGFASTLMQIIGAIRTK